MTDLAHAVVVDAHLDIGWNHAHNRRRFEESAWAGRRRETDPDFVRRYGRRMVGLPEALLGRVALIGATLFVAPAGAKMFPDETVLYETPQQAHELARQQLDYYRRLADEQQPIVLVQTRRDLDAVLASWAAGTTLAEHRVGLMLLMEGADPILEPAQVEEWYAAGLRIIGPAWTRTRYAGGTGAPGPLTDLGRALLDVMAGLGMALDLSHLAPEAAFEALDRYPGPVLASHANPLRFRPDRVDRNLSDDLLRRLAARDGVAGIIPFNLFLVPGWAQGDRQDAATMATVVAAIDHVCQVTGSARHVGIGSDFDGGFGAQSAPVGFETLADLWDIGPALLARGYAPDDVIAVLGGNFLRVMRAALPE